VQRNGVIAEPFMEQLRAVGQDLALFTEKPREDNHP
jgi:hypothetical protein